MVNIGGRLISKTLTVHSPSGNGTLFSWLGRVKARLWKTDKVDIVGRLQQLVELEHHEVVARNVIFVVSIVVHHSQRNTNPLVQFVL